MLPVIFQVVFSKWVCVLSTRYPAPLQKPGFPRHLLKASLEIQKIFFPESGCKLYWEGIGNVLPTPRDNTGREIRCFSLWIGNYYPNCSFQTLFEPVDFASLAFNTRLWVKNTFVVLKESKIICIQNHSYPKSSVPNPQPLPRGWLGGDCSFIKIALS